MIFKVLYRKSPTFRLDTELTVSSIPAKFTFLKIIHAEDMEEAFFKMQGENWSPNGEARSLIEYLELHHTSMSVGDLLQTKAGYFQCDMSGWVEVPR